MFRVKTWFRIFIIVSLIYLLIILLNKPGYLFFLKPLLIPPLIAATVVAAKFQNKIFLTIALLFSWAGDILLLFVSKNDLFFTPGLVAFLIAHIFYIILFFRELKKSGRKTSFNKPAFFLILAYLITMLYVLLPHLGVFTIPVVVYSLVISTMLYTACLLHSHYDTPSSAFLLSGAIAFVASDSILAFDKFYHAFTPADLLIMITYLYAQYALTKAFLK